jgi:tetratricopeptide (TPR) repeat protein
MKSIELSDTDAAQMNTDQNALPKYCRVTRPSTPCVTGSNGNERFMSAPHRKHGLEAFVTTTVSTLCSYLCSSVPHLWLTGICLFVLAGCNAGGLTPNQKAEANKQWNDARVSVMISLATDQYKNGNFDKCHETLDQAMRLEPENADLHLLAAKLAIEQGSLELADSHLAEARKDDPKNAEADYLTGVVLQRWGQPEKAYASYTIAATKNPQELAYLLARAEMLVALSRPSDALVLLRANLSTFEHSAVLRDEIGQLLVQETHYAAAVASLREASILASDDLGIREHLAFAMLKARQFPDAVELFDRLLKDASYTNRADVFAAAGECRIAMGDLRTARTNLESATTLQPQCIGYWLSLGRVTVQVDDLRAAEIAARRAIAVDPDSAESQCLLGYVRLREDQLPAALAAFREASELDHTDTVSLCLQGCVLTKMGHAGQAAELYNRALKLNPHDPLANRLVSAMARGD